MKLSVILLDEATVGAVDLLAELSFQGMLHNCLLVEADGRCQSLERGELAAVEVHEYLAGRALSLARIIRFSLGGSPISAAHLELADRLEASLRPAQVAVEKASIVMPVEGQQVAAAAFPQYWNYNLLIEPSDMAGEAGFAVLPLKDPQRLLVVGTSMLALCGGLWRWLDEGPLDGRSSDADVTSAQVRVVRATTRMVDAGDVASQAVAWALAPGTQFPPPAGCVRHGDPRNAAAALAAQIVSESGSNAFGFAYNAYVPAPAPAPRRMSPLDAIARFLKEFWWQLRRMPSEFASGVWSKVKTAVEKTVTERTYGTDSDIVVSFDSNSSPAVALDPSARAEMVSALPDLNVAAPSSSPTSWSMLTSVVLGSADGLDLPAESGVSAPTYDNQRAVIADVSSLAHPSLAGSDRGAFLISPDEGRWLGWESETGFMIRATEVMAQRATLARIDTVLGGQSLPPPSPSGTATSTTVDGSESSGSSSKSKRKGGGHGPAASVEWSGTTYSTTSGSESAADRKAVAKSLQDLRQRLVTWGNDREHTLLWRVARALMVQQDRAFGHVAQTTSELEQVLKQMESGDVEMAQSGKRFKRRALIILVCLLVLVAVVTIGILFVAAVALAYWLGGLVVGLLGILWAMFRTAAERVRLEHRLTDLVRRPAELIEQRARAANEYVRLASLYQQFQDWAEILAIALHRPLGHLQHAGEKPWTTEVGALSFVSGEPTLDEDRVRATTLGVMQYLATKGWITSAYKWQREFIIDQYNTLAGGVAATDATPEEDKILGDNVIAELPGREGHEGAVVYSARVNLRNRLADGDIADRYRAAQADRMQVAVKASDPFAMIKSVSCDVPGLNNPPRGPRQFLTPIVEWAEVPRLDGMLVDTRRLGDVAVSSVVGISDGLGANLRPGLRTVQVNELPDRFTLAAFRLDVADAVPLRDVARIGDVLPRVDESELPRAHTPVDVDTEFG